MKTPSRLLGVFITVMNSFDSRWVAFLAFLSRPTAGEFSGHKTPSLFRLQVQTLVCLSFRDFPLLLFINKVRVVFLKTS